MSGYLAVPVTVADPAAGMSATATPVPAVLNDTRIGATIPSVPGQTRAQSVAAFETLTGAPLAAWRAELGGSPMPSSIGSTYLSALPAGCRAVIDLLPAVDGSDLAVLDSFAASCEDAGIDASFSVWHEPTGALTAAQYARIFGLAAGVVRKYAGPSGTYRTACCLSGDEITLKGALPSYWPGDDVTDILMPDLYIGAGMKAFALAAPFALAHRKPLGACEFGVQDSDPKFHNYGTQTQNIAYLESFLAAFQGIAATQPVADLLIFQGHNSGQGNFALSANLYAVPGFQAIHSALNTVGYLAA